MKLSTSALQDVGWFAQQWNWAVTSGDKGLQQSLRRRFRLMVIAKQRAVRRHIRQREGAKRCATTSGAISAASESGGSNG